MISEIRLSNFKRFQDLKLGAADLTILTGANGAGKTSIIHSLLLARQMTLHPERNHVEFNGVETLELGSAAEVIHRDAGNESAAIELTDSRGDCNLWSFHAADIGGTQALNAIIDERPGAIDGALARPAPRFSYLCAERLGPRDVLGASAVAVDELDVGPRGEFVAQVLAQFDRARVSPGRVERSSNDSRFGDLRHQTESWMTKIVGPVRIEAERFPNTSVTRLLFKKPGLASEWTRAPNSGFGISYALPIVVAALRAESEGLLIVENPEAHLHPAGQSRIGGFLSQVAADGVQVFVETHSDHVLNGIRLAVASGDSPIRPEQVLIHYLHSDDDGPIHQTMELRSNGQLSAWPAGFFDQSQIDLGGLAAARRRRT